MSRAFVREDAPEPPLVVPPRAPLPEGVPNYVTPAGLDALRAERAALEAERARIDALRSDDPAVQRERRLVAGRLADLVVRLSAATVVDPARQVPGVVRFGATVVYEGADGRQSVRIVGVDEAAADDGTGDALAVAFTSPVARALTSAKPGDRVRLETPRGAETLRVLGVCYGG